MLRLVTQNDLAELRFSAFRNPRLRMNYNIHDSYDDACQRFLNAVGYNSYIQPHKHPSIPHLETLVSISGRLLVILFSDCGKISEVKILSNSASTDGNPIVSIPSNIFHTVLALDQYSILFECKAGPFKEHEGKIHPSWAPEPDTEDAFQYLKNLKIRAGKFLNLSAAPKDEP